MSFKFLLCTALMLLSSLPVKAQEQQLLIYCGISAALMGNISNLAPDLPVVRPTILFAVPRVFTRIYDGVEQSITARGGFADW